MILYQQHIMWYESNILKECLDSLYEAIKFSISPVYIKLCFNFQTSLEEPIVKDELYKTYDIFINHPINLYKKLSFIIKYNHDNFYNIGDWRREVYEKDYKYTVWGETDCLIPKDYFYILSGLNIEEPHILSLSSRIMWDGSWKDVIHKDLQKCSFVDNKNPKHDNLKPFRYFDVISQNELDNFNDKFNIEIIKLFNQKIDGALLALSGKIPTPFIAPNMNFVREDTCAEFFFRRKNIPQYHITTRLKGHNYYHPDKRTNTNSTRNEKEWKLLEEKQINEMVKFINEI